MKKYAGKDVLFLGDSITEGANASSVENNFVSLFGKLTGAHTYNYGLGGTRIAYQINPTIEEPQYDSYFSSRVLRMNANADLIFVFGGTNDFGHGDAPLGTFGDKSPKTFYGALHDLYGRLQWKYPNAKIVAITPLHCDNDEKEVNKRGIEKKGGLRTYVEAIKEVATSFNIPVIDAFNDWDMKPVADKDKEVYFSVDGLHPNDKGHQRIAEKLLEFVNNNVL